MSDLDFDLRVLSHEQLPHLRQFEWEALGRMADKAGATVIKTVLRSGDADIQRLAAQAFMARELAEARGTRQTTSAQMFRKYPETLEAAFAIALREEFNARQARSASTCLGEYRWLRADWICRLFKPNVAKDGARALLGP
ncbi:TPA: hypothetical protein N0F65_011550 [Lagenidium giganteum]|uniref:Uncharacterized protein n=1 Tax=Lagenidium giganteum TaxID=4803 RepID=A0AAV2Z7Q4_9STRA|nr:TPA: hypothetical protein N0F65_011550 [Lagenidium giganteum]